MNSSLEQIYRVLTPKEQIDGKAKTYYVMSIKFALKVTLAGIERMNNIIDDGRNIVTTIRSSTATCYMQQITSFIPNEEVIARYAKIIADTHNENPNKSTVITDIKFVGYDYLYAVTPIEEKEGVPTKNALYELVKHAMEDKLIKIKADPNGDGLHGPVAAINDDWLYFDSDPDAENMTPDEYVKSRYKDRIHALVTDAIWNLWQSDPDSPEAGYIFACLYENMMKVITESEG